MSVTCRVGEAEGQSQWIVTKESGQLPAEHGPGERFCGRCEDNSRRLAERQARVGGARKRGLLVVVGAERRDKDLFVGELDAYSLTTWTELDLGLLESRSVCVGYSDESPECCCRCVGADWDCDHALSLRRSRRKAECRLGRRHAFKHVFPMARVPMFISVELFGADHWFDGVTDAFGELSDGSPWLTCLGWRRHVVRAEAL